MRGRSSDVMFVETIDPVDGTCNPASVRSSVLFPAPTVPMMATLVPGVISRSSACRAGSLASG